MFNFWDWEKNPKLEGTFVGQYKSVGAFKKNVFSFRPKGKGKNSVVHSWAYVQLGNVLHGVPFQSKVKVTYLGWAKMPDSDRKFKNFEIEIEAGPEEEEDEEGGE